MELEIQLDELRELYNNVIRNSNSKAQQKKMAFLERNLEQLTLVQKQVSPKNPDEGLVPLCMRCGAEAQLLPQLVDQNTVLKKEAGIAERKLLSRSERIQYLEVRLQDADRRLEVENARFQAQLKGVRERLDEARGVSYMSQEGSVIPAGRHSERFAPSLTVATLQLKNSNRTLRHTLDASLSLCEVAVAAAPYQRARRRRFLLPQVPPRNHHRRHRTRAHLPDCRRTEGECDDFILASRAHHRPRLPCPSPTPSSAPLVRHSSIFEPVLS